MALANTACERAAEEVEAIDEEFEIQREVGTVLQRNGF